MQENQTLEAEVFLNSGALMQVSKDRWVVGYGTPQWQSEPSEQKSSFYAPDFFLTTSRPWLVFPYNVVMSAREWREWCRGLDGWAVKPQWNWRGPEKTLFAEGLKQLKSLMARGEIEKAVPVHFERSDEKVTAGNLAYLIRQTTQAPTNLRPYGFWFEGEGMLGLTPEELFEYRSEGGSESMSTVALAGTRPRFEAARRPLLEDPKERREHAIVLEDLCQRLDQWGDVIIEETEVLQLPHLEHLRARLEVQSSNLPAFSEMVRELHPTPALGASPRECGMKWLAELNEKERRYRFGAPFGLSLHSGEALCLVAIRNLQWNSEGIHLGSGCGIVEQSELEREWKELALKRSGVRKFLDL